MVYGKKMQLLTRFTLVMFLICIIASYTGSMTVNAGISDSKLDIIQILSPVLDGDQFIADRQEILGYLVGPDGLMKAVSSTMVDNVITVLNRHTGGDPGVSVDKDTLTKALNDFYQFQNNRPTEAKYMLSRFEDGLSILDPGNTSGFPTIESKINKYTYNYLMLLNFIKEVKVNFNAIDKNNAKPLYEGSDNKIHVNAELERLLDLSDVFGGIIQIDAYKDKLVSVVTETNKDIYNDERPAFIRNLSSHGLLDEYITPHDHDDGGPTGGGTSGGTTPPATTGPTTTANSDGTASVKLTAALNSTTGNANASVSESTISQLISLSKPQADGTKDIVIEIPKVSNAKGYTLDIPGNALSKPTESEDIIIKTDIGTVTLPSNAFAGDDSVKNKNVSLTIAAADKSTLTPEQQQRIGDKPVISLSFMVNGVAKEYNNPNAPITVTFNYKPTAAELTDPEFLVVWYIDNAGNLIEVPSGKYDPVTGTVSFTTTHLSKFALAYNHKLFIDINNSHWAKKTIEILASKGIARGTTDKTFAPEDNITRGDYIAMLVKALNVDAATNETFADISINDVNFKEIAIAKKLGITKGVGNNMFKPNDYITRQDLFVLTDRALTVLKKIKARGTSADLDKFTDNAKIAAYARDSFSTVVHEGICIGCDKNEANPLGTTTRAQAATIVYRVYNK